MSLIQLNGLEARSVDVQVAMEEDGIEEDEWEQACRLQAEFDEGMWDAPSCSPPNLTTDCRTFQAAKKFGIRSGMEFKKGVDGLGYYPNAACCHFARP